MISKDNIDYRVVEMRFDNKQFEAGAKQSMSTLGKLKEALKLPDTSKALEGLGKASQNIKLDGISAGIEVLEKRFSTLGIVGMRVIENITDGLMNKLNAAVNFVTNSIVSGGIKRAMNIENAHFQLQALLKDEEKVQAVMADAMESVDGTAYAYDEAAKAASQFAASGIQAGDDMLNALKGITGVAAMTNSSFEDIARVFTTVAGNGRLMGDQLLQLSSRGLNAASTLTEYFREVRGQAGMTEGTIRDMVSDGEISFKDFSDAMTWAFGDSAKRANETFTGAMSNMKSALARIGAGFISPLVEQNGELVQLFNALRIKINDVKSALVFDEGRSAIAGLSEEGNLFFDTMTKIVKDGSVGFDEITTAILGTTKNEEDLAKINVKLSNAFEEIKEQGFASAEALSYFNKNGINSYQSIQSYINGVLDGTIRVSDATKQVVYELTDGMPIGIKKINDLAEEGKISFDIFSEAIVKTSGLVETETKFTSETIKNMMADVKANGAVTEDALMEFRKNGMNAYTALRDYMNGVLDGSVRASYATKQAIEEITEGTEIGIKDIEKFAKEGKINFDIFQSALENAYGTEKTLSKQFTDTFQDMVKNIVKAINEADMTKPMEVFYYGVESVKNVSKGLLSVVKPISKAFAEVFLSFDPDEVITFAEAIEKLTSKMKLSEKGSENLHDAFKGVFDVVKLLVDIFFALFGAIVPINKPVLELGGGFLDLIGFMGRGLTEFTKMIRSCKTLRKAFDVMSDGISFGMRAFSKIIKVGKDFITTLYGTDETQAILDGIYKSFKKLSDKVVPYIEDFIKESEDMFKIFSDIEDIDINDVLNAITKAFSNLSSEAEKLNFKNAEEAIEYLKQKIKDFGDFLMSKEGIYAFVTNAKEYGEELKDAFSWDSLMGRLEKIMDVFGKFFNWIKESLAPSFENFNVGSALATGGGLGIIYSMIKASKAFENLSKSIKSVPDLLNSVGGTLKAYQQQLKADALLKIAIAIGVLAGALVLLSFADTDRLLKASVALGIVAGVLLFGVSKLLEAINKGRSLNDAAKIFAKGLSSTMKKLARAMEIKALGSAIKDFAISIGIIAASIISLGLMYKNDPEAFTAALKTVTGIGFVLAAFAGLLIIGSNFSNSRGIKAIGTSVLMISLSLALIVGSISKLMKMDLPDDYKVKLGILGSILKELAVLAVALGLAARISGGNALPKMASTIKSLAILLVATVLSLKVLFNMDLPDDYKVKLGILGSIFASFAALLVVMGLAARISGGNGIKAASSILAMAVFLAVVVGALFVLTLIPTDKMLTGAIGLGVVLIALGAALYGAGKITGKNTYKTVLAMAITIGVITAALSILTMIKWQKLMTSAVALGIVLTSLAMNFQALSKVNSKNSIVPVMLMITTTLAIAYALAALSTQPWEGLLAAGIAMSLTLMAFAAAYQMILKPNWSKNAPAKIAVFGMLTAAIIPISAGLIWLSKEPWSGLLGAAVAMSLTLMAFAAAYQMILKPNWSKNAPAKIGIFLLLTAALLPITAALKALSNSSWDSMLSAAISLSVVLLTMAAVMAILVAVKANVAEAVNAALALDAFIAIVSVLILAIGAIITGIGALYTKFPNLEEYLNKGIEIMILLAGGLGTVIGTFVNNLAVSMTAGLPQIGKNLSDFMMNLMPFIVGSKMLDASSIATVGLLAGVIVALSAANFISGIIDLYGLKQFSLVDIATNLSEFMEALIPFIIYSKMLSPESVVAVGLLAGAIVALTVAEFISGVGSLMKLSLNLVALELSAFMINLLPFIVSSRLLKKESVEACVMIADMIMTLTQAQLLNGIGQWLGITGNLSDFAEELNAFGPAIAEFAETVKDVKPEAVEGAANAASIMAEVSDKLQGHGGILQSLIGDKSFKTFAEELNAFGPAIAEFAETVKDVKPEAVEGAANAASIMAEVANNLPETESLKSKLIGKSVSIAEFGEQLTIFGDSIVPFCDKVADINTESISGVQTIINIMTELAEKLPEEESVKSILFGGTNSSFSEFGKQLVGLAERVVEFSDRLLGLDIAMTTSFLELLEKYVDLAINSENVDFKNLITEMNNLGNNGIKSFLDPISNSNQKVEAAIKLLATGVKKSLEINKLLVINGMKLVVTGMIDVAKNGLSMNTFKNIASNAINGLVNGIKDKIQAVKDVAKDVASTLVDSLEGFLKIKSPSRRLMQTGEYAGEGFLIPLMKTVAKAAKLGSEIGEETVSGIESSLTPIYDVSDPVIRPVVDLSEVQKSALEVQKAFNDSINLTASYAQGVASSFETRQLNNTIQTAQKVDTDKAKLKDYIDTSINNKMSSITVKVDSKVTLQGTAKDVFKLVKQENDWWIENNHYNPLASKK